MGTRLLQLERTALGTVKFFLLLTTSTDKYRNYRATNQETDRQSSHNPLGLLKKLSHLHLVLPHKPKHLTVKLFLLTINRLTINLRTISGSNQK